MEGLPTGELDNRQSVLEYLDAATAKLEAQLESWKEQSTSLPEDELERTVYAAALNYEALHAVRDANLLRSRAEGDYSEMPEAEEEFIRGTAARQLTALAMTLGLKPEGSGRLDLAAAKRLAKN